MLALGGAVGDVLAVGSELIRIDAPGLPDSLLPAAPKSRPQQIEPAPARIEPEPASPSRQRRRPEEPAQQRLEGAPPPARACTGRAASCRVKSRSPRPPCACRRARPASISGTCAAPAPRDASRTTTSTPFSPARRRRVATARAGAKHAVETIKVVGLRRRIAQNMAEFARRVAHFSYVEEVDVTALEELRASLNARATEERPRLTLLPFLMLAIVKAVAEFPQINAHYDDDNDVIRRFGAVHLGIATQTPTGLMVPVVRHAETLGLYHARAKCAGSARPRAVGSRRARSCRARRSRSLRLGALGGIVSTPIVNRPEVAIVGVNKIVVRPVWRDGAFVPRKIMNLSSSFDHRVVDGYDAATFIQRLRALLEQPALLFIEDE